MEPRRRQRTQVEGVLLERMQGLPHVTNTVTLLLLDKVVRRPYVLP